MKTKLFALSIVITSLAACNNNSATDPEFNYNKITKQGDSTKNNSQLLVPEDTTHPNIIPAAATPGSGATGPLNPAHGQPGHRCEIAVGAPLNSKPAATTSTTPVEQKQPQTVTTTTAPLVNTYTPTSPVVAPKTTTAAGMNPPHGEPGHRCEIAVGAPLNSKPTTPATPTTVVPEKQTAAATTKTVTAPGMNPPHGEPGHRCDIGVGTPLSQPVKTPAAVVKDPNKK